jgi:hypothetical protein
MEYNRYPLPPPLMQNPESKGVSISTADKI